MRQGQAQDVCIALAYDLLDGAAIENLRRVLLAVDAARQLAELRNADDIARVVGRFPDRQRRKSRVYLLAQLLLAAVQLLHEGIMVIARLQHAVADHAVNWIAEERQVGFCPQRLFDDHTFGIDDRSIRADFRVGEHFAQTLDPLAQHLYGVEYFPAGDEGFDEWTRQAE